MSAREEILARVRGALADVPRDDHVDVDWTYGRATPLESVLDTFEENILDYGASLTRVSPDEVGAAIARVLRDLGVSSLVVPADLPAAWLAGLAGEGFDREGLGEVRVVADSAALTARDLDAIDAVLTGSVVSAAETGTICLDHGVAQGRRAISLVPDIHVCVVMADSVVSDIPEAVARLQESVAARRPITWISGGSATSDIELSRVEGVHGPRTLHVVLVD